MEVISPELNFSQKSESHSTQVVRDIAAQNSSSRALSTVSTVGATEFVISPQVFNLAKSKICFRLNVPEVDTKYVHLVDHGLAKIARVTLFDNATNAVWADLNNCPQYASQMRAATKLEDLHSSKPTYAGAVKATVATADTVALEDVRPAKSTSAVDMSNDDIGAENPYQSVRYTVSGAVGDGAGAGDVHIRYEIPLSAFKMTALDTNKMIYNPSNLTLQIFWAPTNDYACTSDSTNPADTPVSLVEGADLKIDDISLRLYGESNIAISSQIMERVMGSGLELVVPYITTVKQSLSSSTKHAFQQQLSSGMGSRVIAILTTPFSNTNFQSSIGKLGNITRYDSKIDNISVKYPKGFNCLKNEHWSLNKEYFKGSIIQSPVQHNKDIVFLDSFFGEKSLADLDPTTISGFSLQDRMATYQLEFDLSSATALTYLTTIVAQKTLKLSAGGSMVM